MDLTQMHNLNLKDALTVLAIKKSFQLKNNVFSLSEYNETTPLFPIGNGLNYIIPLVKKYYIVDTSSEEFALSDKSVNFDFTISTKFKLLVKVSEDTKKEMLFKKDQKEINEILSMECASLLNYYISLLRNTDKFSSSTMTRSFILEALNNNLTVMQIFHVIQASYNSASHLLRVGSFEEKIAASQFIKLFKGNLLKVTEGKIKNKESVSIPSKWKQSIYSKPILSIL